MRFLVGLGVVLAAVAVPAGAGAQDAKENPALQLELDDAGIEVAPNPTLTPNGYTRVALERQAKQAKIGLGVSSIAFVAGTVFAFTALGHTDAFFPSGDPPQAGWVAPLGWTGVALMGTGAAGLLTSGILLGVRRRKVPGWPQERVRRIQWDLARSRVAF
jgi:hypothetical protein